MKIALSELKSQFYILYHVTLQTAFQKQSGNSVNKGSGHNLTAQPNVSTETSSSP